MELMDVPLDLIDLNPDNERDPAVGIEPLVESIANEGLQEPPLLVRRGERFLVIFGNRRVYAHRVLRRDCIKALVREPDDPDTERLRSLMSHLQKRGLHPLETARALKTMEASGMSKERLSKATGLSLSHISQYLAVADRVSNVVTSNPQTIDTGCAHVYVCFRKREFDGARVLDSHGNKRSIHADSQDY